jgi:serine/threonine protein kinase/tetratricopeptide (TPR) repeat protein
LSTLDRPTTKLWREALAQFEVLLQQPPERRERMLTDIGQTQPQLYSMLASLLEAESRADRSGFLDPPKSQDGALGPGTQLGPYRIQSQIGAGGMGEVWLATRDDGLYQGEVAIKTLHPYFGGGVLRERFLLEAQILGRLTHPNIARLLDAGTSTDGGVYLVLEYVRGASIDAWSDERKLTVDARLRLFLDVCAAVAQAHANLVVHRDIKPSNILVNGNGQVKLLDFGVAKLLEAEPLAGRTELTRMTGRIFTPEYAAPEQILGEPVTTATDVYALGVLLHVHLTGVRPYGNASNPVEIERAVLHDEPGRASLAISPDAQAAAAARSTTPARLRRVLGGDLDNIIARALRKAPGDRYASVSALAEDIQRHLAHQPILARPESLAARSRKFVRRHRLGVAASLLMVVATGAGIGGIVWQAQLARTEARKATAIKDFVVGIFERNSTSHPDGAGARNATAEQLLSQASSEIRDGLKDAPEVRTELLGLMSRLYANMEMQKDALPLLAEQLASQRRALGNSHPDVARTLVHLASSQTQSGDYPNAVRSATEAQQIFRAVDLESALEYAQTYKVIGFANYRLGKLEDDNLRRNFQTGLDLVTTYHPHDPERLSMLEGLSRAEQNAGNHERSLALLLESARLVESGFVKVDGIQRGGLYQSLGDRLSWASRNDEAETYMRKAIVEYERAGGPEHPYTSDGKRALGMLLAWHGRREEAKGLLQSAFESQQRVRGDEDPQLTSVIRLDLGRVLLMRGEFVEGERHLQRVIELWRISGAPLVNTRIQLARLHTEQGRFELAVKDLEGIEESAIKVHGAGSWMHATAINRQGDLHLAQGQLREAQHFFDRTDKETKDMPGMSPNRAYARAGLLRIALMQRDPRAADLGTDLLAQIESAGARADMPDEEATANMLLGIALMKAGKWQQAQPYLEKAVEMRARMDAPVSPLLAEARLYLAQQRELTGARIEARELIALAAQALGAQQTGPRYQRLLAETRARVSSTA